MKKYKINRKLITVKCDYCNMNHEKPETEYLRNIKLNRKNFCSRNCVGKYKYTNRTEISSNFMKNYNSNTNKTQNIINPFKYYLKCAKSRFKECTISLEDLEKQWNFQNGICPYSGIKLILNSHSNISKDKIYSASLDRIDSSKGYIIGNIQYVSQCINFMKNNMTHENTIKICKIISDNWNQKSDINIT